MTRNIIFSLQNTGDKLAKEGEGNVVLEIEKIIKERSNLIDQEIEKVFPKNGIPNMYDAAWYHLGTGGKRLRPILAIMTCEALGGNVQKVIPFAAACEILHNWMLIHDDIEDNDKMRRNKPAVWVKYGLEHGINVGDMMAHKVFQLILRSQLYGLDEKTTLRLITIVVNTTIKTAEGQTMDMNLRKNDTPTEKEYMQMVEGKTTDYLTVPMVGAAIIAGANGKTIKNIIKFGTYTGPAFQITDDLLDLTEGKGRKEIGRDIKEGKRSILVVHCLQKCSNDEKKKLIEILNKPVESTTDEDVKLVKKLFEKHGSIEYAQKRANDLIQNSKEIIKDMPPKLRSLLDYFGNYMVTRRK